MWDKSVWNARFCRLLPLDLFSVKPVSDDTIESHKTKLTMEDTFRLNTMPRVKSSVYIHGRRLLSFNSDFSFKSQVHPNE